MQIPNATYRIQLHAGFTLCQLEGILDYLHELGISTIYASPITQSVKGSMHGYDGTNPLHIDPEIGTEKEWRRLSVILKGYRMGWLQDIVPNHLAFDGNNPWLFDLLQKGDLSPYYHFFDIDWDHPDPALKGKLLAPFLGDSPEACAERSEIRLERGDQGYLLRYFDQVYPVDLVCDPWIDEQTRPKDDPSLLMDLLQRQHYVLMPARLAAEKINYRRFFTINSLICLRMEDETVFNAFHKTLLSWYKQDLIQGLRIDHIDGLANPAQYVRRLKEGFGPECYIVAEKILQADESLPGDWPLEGTTGYDFLFLVNQLLSAREGGEQITEFYKELVPSMPSYDELRFKKKYDFLKKYMGGELDNLVNMLMSTALIQGQERKTIKEALAILMALFPVYRIYPHANRLPDADRRVIETAFARARQKAANFTSVFDGLEDLFVGTGITMEDWRSLPFRTRLMQFTGPLAAKGIEDTVFYNYDPLLSHNEVGDTPALQGIGVEEFHERMVGRQISHPLTMNATATHDTKRGEDARIRLNLLSAIPWDWIAAVCRWRNLNRSFIKEVHGHPAPTPNDEYFIYQALLGGLPTDMILTEGFKERFSKYLVKALREAKTETCWEEPDELYEKACLHFADAICGRDGRFLKDFIPFASQVIQKASVYSLSQLLIKLTAPGIPDIYQGADLWDLSFVDPDNRRPVNYDHRRFLLKEIADREKKGIASLLGFLSDNRATGVEKLFIIKKTLAYRNLHPLVFTRGEYLPVRINPHWISYLRKFERDWILVIAPLIREASERVKDIGILTLDLPLDAPTQWKNEFTGQGFTSGSLPVNTEIFAGFPVTLLSGRT